MKNIGIVFIALNEIKYEVTITLFVLVDSIGRDRSFKHLYLNSSRRDVLLQKYVYDQN